MGLWLGVFFGFTFFRIFFWFGGIGFVVLVSKFWDWVWFCKGFFSFVLGIVVWGVGRSGSRLFF